jgi:hypothetical protein
VEVSDGLFRLKRLTLVVWFRRHFSKTSVSVRESNKGQIILKGSAAATLAPFSAGNQLILDFLHLMPGLFYIFGDELRFQLVHVPAALCNQAPHAPGHARELAGPEDDQEEDSYDHQL